MTIINLFGGPGVGKSFYASLLFPFIGCLGHKIELVTEFAKELTNEERFNTLDFQFYVTAKQSKKILMLRDKADYVITDSPMILGLAYKGYAFNQQLHDYILTLHNLHSSVNIFIEPAEDIPYQRFGRNQNSEESAEKSRFIKNLLIENEIHHISVVNRYGIDNALDLVRNTLVPYIL